MDFRFTGLHRRRVGRVRTKDHRMLKTNELFGSRCIKSAAIFLFVLTSRALAQQGLPANLQPIALELDRTATELTKGPNSSGLTLGIVTRHGLVWPRMYGFPIIQNNLP